MTRYHAVIIVEFTDADVEAGCGNPKGEAIEIIETFMGALDCPMWIDEVREIQEGTDERNCNP